MAGFEAGFEVDFVAGFAVVGDERGFGLRAFRLVEGVGFG